MNAKKNREGTSIISEAEHRTYMLAAVLIAKLKSRVYDIYIHKFVCGNAIIFSL